MAGDILLQDQIHRCIDPTNEYYLQSLIYSPSEPQSSVFAQKLLKTHEWATQVLIGAPNIDWTAAENSPQQMHSVLQKQWC